MVIVEYVNDPQDKPRSYHPKTIPSFITEGGQWMNPDGSEKMIGVGDGDVPDTMVALNLEELQARQRAIHANYPMKKYDYSIVDPSQREDMTDDEVDAAVKEWFDARS
tara:strand:+ start:19 stop:342 length:324 start_codon:yes stop_codon:yes gene_type:complete